MKPLIIANWKMNPSNSKEAFDLAKTIAQGVQGVEADVVLCPPFVYISDIVRASSFARQQTSYGGSSVAFGVGGQDCFWEHQGPYTGEVSPVMLRSLGCTYVILGHSERERFVNETMQMVQKKVKSALVAGLVPVVCIGDYDEGNRNQELGAKMRGILKGLSLQDVSKTVLVYEPVWAISTNPGSKPATAKDVKEAVACMRSIAKKTTILYGGSVNSKNITEFLEDDTTQGALVGGASLDAEEFIALVKNAALI